MRERVLAVVGALALVAAAFVVRSLIVGDDGGGTGDGSSAGSLPVVACTKDLMAVCDALEAEGAIAADPPAVELGSDGAKTATVDDVPVDGWITWDPAPTLANFDGGSKAAWTVDAQALSTDQLAVIGPNDDIAALQSGCGLTWECIASSGERVGIGRPTTAQGIARLAPLAAALAEDLDPETLDTAAIRTLLGTKQQPLEAQLKALNQPGFWDLVVGPKTLLDRAAATPQGKNRKLRVGAVEPSATISVVLATSATSDQDLSGLVTVVRSDALTDARDDTAMTAPPGATIDPALAGFLYQVRDKVG